MLAPRIAVTTLLLLGLVTADARADDLQAGTTSLKKDVQELQQAVVKLRKEVAQLKDTVKGPQPEGRTFEAIEPKSRLPALPLQMPLSEGLNGKAKDTKLTVSKLPAEVKRSTEPEPPGRSKFFVQVYPLRDFQNGEAVIPVLTTMVKPPSWAQNGGEAAIVYFVEGKSLVIKQSAEAHKEIQELLGALRDTKQSDKPK